MFRYPAFLHRGPLGSRSPASQILSGHYDFLPPVPPHFVAFAWRYHGSIRLFSFLPPSPNATRRAWGCSTGIPIRCFFHGDDRISQVPGEPQYPFAHVLRLRPDGMPLTKTARPHGPRERQDEGSSNNRLSKLSSMAFGLAVYASRCKLPGTAQDSFPGAGQALLGGLPPAGFR